MNTMNTLSNESRRVSLDKGDSWPPNENTTLIDLLDPIDQCSNQISSASSFQELTGSFAEKTVDLMSQRNETLGHDDEDDDEDDDDCSVLEEHTEATIEQFKTQCSQWADDGSDEVTEEKEKETVTENPITVQISEVVVLDESEEDEKVEATGRASIHSVFSEDKQNDEEDKFADSYSDEWLNNVLELEKNCIKAESPAKIQIQKEQSNPDCKIIPKDESMKATNKRKQSASSENEQPKRLQSRGSEFKPKATVKRKAKDPSADEENSDSLVQNTLTQVLRETLVRTMKPEKTPPCFRNSDDGIFFRGVWLECIKDVLAKSQNGVAGYLTTGSVDHIHASPPCQGFSAANRNGGQNDEHNNGMVLVTVEKVRFIRPSTFSFENLTSMLDDVKANRQNEQDHTTKRNYLQYMVAELLLLGYQVRVCVLNAAEYGDPQKRKRVILFAALYNFRLPDIPEATHGPGLLPILTARDALKKLEDLKPTDGIVVVPDCGRVTHHNMEPVKAESETLDADKPARTIRTANGVKHYNQDRGISSRERACLQSFPLDYRFSGTPAQISKQIGNAVPVNLATAIAKSIIASHQVRLAEKVRS